MHLNLADAGRLTERSIVRNSIVAPVDVAGLENRHFLDATGLHAARAFPPQHTAASN